MQCWHAHEFEELLENLMDYNCGLLVLDYVGKRLQELHYKFDCRGEIVVEIIAVRYTWDFLTPARDRPCDGIRYITLERDLFDMYGERGVMYSGHTFWPKDGHNCLKAFLTDLEWVLTTDTYPDKRFPMLKRRRI